MAENKRYETIDLYIEDQPKEIQEKLRILKKCILIAAPKAKELFNYGIPAFALVEGGKREEQIMIAGYKKHVGLYPHPTVIEHFTEELRKFKKGKGSVQFQINEQIPEELIIEMVKYRLKILNNI